MIIFFDGPDEVKKTTLLKATSEATGIPVWERGPYLPYHHGKKYNDEDSLWYVLDDMKTIHLLESLGRPVLVDRHPIISEIVYRREEGKTSPLEGWANRRLPCQSAVLLIYNNKTKDSDVVGLYQDSLKSSNLPYRQVYAENVMAALNGIVKAVEVWQKLPKASGVLWNPMC